MKKILCLALMAFCSSGLFAQEDAISKFFEKYNDREDFTHVSVTSRMFGLFTNMEVEDQEDQEVLDAISKLKGLKILAKEDTKKGKSLYKEALSLIPSKEFDELMSVRDEDNDIKFLIKEKDGKINELLMIMGGEDDFFAMSLYGEIDLKQVSKISSKMSIDGLEELDKLKDSKKEKK